MESLLDSSQTDEDGHETASLVEEVSKRETKHRKRETKERRQTGEDCFIGPIVEEVEIMVEVEDLVYNIVYTEPSGEARQEGNLAWLEEDIEELGDWRPGLFILLFFSSKKRLCPIFI